MDIDYEREVAEFEWDIPEDYNLPDVVAGHAADHGDRVAVKFRNDAGESAVRTYADIWDDAQRFANALDALGVGEGDRVMHLFPRHPDAFAVQVGALATGALLVPCSELLKPKDIQFRATDCEATVMVAHHSLTDMVDPVADDTPLEHLISLGGDAEGWASFADLLDAEDPDYTGPSLDAQTPMTINYTSGTTGQPKPVQHRHRWMYCFATINGRYWWGIDEDTDLSAEYLWATTGTGWAKWFWSPVGVALTSGATQFLYEGDFEPATFLDLLEEEEITKLCAVPTQYRMFSQEDLSEWDVALTDVLSAGEPLNRDPIQAFEDAFSITPRDGYGQTETVAIASNYPGIDVKPGSMGVPCPGIGTTIIDTMEETEVETGEIGEIAVPVDCPAIFDGYYERPDLDEQTFSGDYYRTGDLASRDEDGYLFFEGRADDIIISSGYRIGPFEVEDAIVAHPAVTEAAAVASPDEERGNIVKAFVVLADGYEPSDDLVEEIQNFVKAETAPYKYPRRVEFVDELPKTSSGKTRRIELRSEEADDREE